MGNKLQATSYKVQVKSGSGKRVALGLSGGVDSSVSAALLLDQGYDVTGVFLECWESGRPGCRVDQDRKDALEIALKLNIPFKVLDFKQAYSDKVLEYFYTEYQAGRTPNPDTLCNREIKFGLFYKWALEEGFDFVSTGHYARIKTLNPNIEIRNNLKADIPNQNSDLEFSASNLDSQTDSESIKINSWILNQVQDDKNQPTHSPINLLTNQPINQLTDFLQRGADPKKDQSYFLYQLRPDQLSHILFPIGHLTKDQVRQIATKRGLTTATKPDSQGICFIGNVNVTDFLKERIEEKVGEVVVRVRVDELMSERVSEIIKPIHPFQPEADRPLDETNKLIKIGSHKGVFFHTIGQKVGKEIDQALVAKLAKKGLLPFDPTLMPPLFVIDKDIQNNRLIVGTEEQTYRQEFEVTQVNWLIEDKIVNELMSEWEKNNQDPINPSTHSLTTNLYLRIRHGGELVKVKSYKEQGTSDKSYMIKLEKPIRGVAPGQACVFYVPAIASATVGVPEDQKALAKEVAQEGLANNDQALPSLQDAIVLGGGVIV